MFRKILFISLSVFLAGIFTVHAADKGQGKNGRHLLITFSSTNGVLKVEKVEKVNLPLPKTRKGKNTRPWKFNLQDATGTSLYENSMEDPSVVRGEFQNPDDPDKIDSVNVTTAGPVYFSVRVPDIRAARISFKSLKHGSQPFGQVNMPSTGDNK